MAHKGNSIILRELGLCSVKMVQRRISLAFSMKRTHVGGARVEQEIALMNNCGGRVALRTSGIHNVRPTAALTYDIIQQLDRARLR